MRTQRTDSGVYNRPAIIQAPASYVDDGQGGNTNAGVWVTVRSPMIELHSLQTVGHGLSRGYSFSQLYPEASHYASLRYASDVVINATMVLITSGRTFQILGADDVALEHVTTILALLEYQSKGSL